MEPTPHPTTNGLPFDRRDIISQGAIVTDDENEDESDDVFGNSAGLGAQDMIRKGSPTHHQSLVKLHMPYLYQFLPWFVQRYICRTACLAKHKWLAPAWHRRYLILTGDYLYRFKSEYSTSPKGTPLLVQQSKARMVIVRDREGLDDESITNKEHGIQFALEHLPVGTQGVFAVQVDGLGSKHQYYGVTTVEDARVWVHSLRQSKQEIIQRHLGHSKVPQPKSWEFYNKMGAQYLARKERIKARLDEYNTKDMEMTAMAIGGPMSTRGIYT